MQFKSLKLSDIIFLQDFGVNPEKYKFLGVNGHIGCDISIGKGQQIPAFAGGTVVYINPTGGDVVIIDGMYEYTYSHMQDIKVSVGNAIKAGNIIASQGSTGATIQESEYWSHLHFGVRRISMVKNPQLLKWNFPALSPIDYSIVDINNGFEGYINPNSLFPLVVERVADAQELFENMPAKYNNPGALRWSKFETGSVKDSSGLQLSTFTSIELGRQAQIFQLTIAANGKSAYYKPWMTTKQFVDTYAPSTDRNSSKSRENYTKALTDEIGIKQTITISNWLLNEYEYIRKNCDTQPDGGIWIDNLMARQINIMWTTVKLLLDKLKKQSTK